MPGGIGGETGGDALAGEMRRPAEAVPDDDVARPIHRRTCHPAVEAVRCERALLREHQSSAIILRDDELVPAHAAGPCLGVDGVHGDDALATVHVPVDHPGHDLVALRIQAPIGAGLRDTVGQLAAAQVMIGRDACRLRTGDASLRRVFPVHAERPRVDPVIVQVTAKLRSTGGEHRVGRARRRELCPLEVGVVEEVHAIHHHALFRRRFSAQHAHPIDHTGVLLDHVVAGAGGDVVPVGPDRRSRVVGEQRAQELVPVPAA